MTGLFQRGSKKLKGIKRDDQKKTAEDFGGFWEL
jgi:hypothetical protein